MFEEVVGLPAHPLLVHAPVVLVPLLAIGAVLYAFVPLTRPHIRWVTGLLAVAAPLSALFAKLSGDAFFARLDEAGQITEGFYPTIEAHQDLGNLTLIFTSVFAVLTLALVYLVQPGRAAAEAAGSRRHYLLLALRVATVVAAAVSLYYLIRTGDSGARAVWEGQ